MTEEELRALNAGWGTGKAMASVNDRPIETMEQARRVMFPRMPPSPPTVRRSAAIAGILAASASAVAIMTALGYARKPATGPNPCPALVQWMPTLERKLVEVKSADELHAVAGTMGITLAPVTLGCVADNARKDAVAIHLQYLREAPTTAVAVEALRSIGTLVQGATP